MLWFSLSFSSIFSFSSLIRSAAVEVILSPNLKVFYLLVQEIAIKLEDPSLVSDA